MLSRTSAQTTAQTTAMFVLTAIKRGLLHEPGQQDLLLHRSAIASLSNSEIRRVKAARAHSSVSQGGAAGCEGGPLKHLHDSGGPQTATDWPISDALLSTDLHAPRSGGSDMQLLVSFMRLYF